MMTMMMMINGIFDWIQLTSHGCQMDSISLEKYAFCSTLFVILIQQYNKSNPFRWFNSLFNPWAYTECIVANKNSEICIRSIWKTIIHTHVDYCAVRRAQLFEDSYSFINVNSQFNSRKKRLGNILMISFHMEMNWNMKYDATKGGISIPYNIVQMRVDPYKMRSVLIK